MAYSMEEIILKHFHGFTKEQWAELKDRFPYCEIPAIMEEYAINDAVDFLLSMTGNRFINPHDENHKEQAQWHYKLWKNKQ